MKRVGFLGCGKIGGTMLEELLKAGEHRVAFVQDPFYGEEKITGFPVIRMQDEELLEKTDLVIETATAEVLKENIDGILKYCDLMVFSVTAFSEEAFLKQVQKLMQKYNRKIYLPHGAILGVDGISDGSGLISSVTIETIKNPESLGRNDNDYTVVYEGTAREACRAYPRNVNVHATVALAGIGFDKTKSRIISDPSTSENTHKIVIQGDGIHFEIQISSFSAGGVTGKYTPYSAVASMNRVLEDKPGIRFV